jgi:hypothetical protein
MKLYFKHFLLIVLLLSISGKLLSQNNLPFGDIRLSDLANKPYTPDPGADAIILSDKGVATLNYFGSSFYIELERDVRIRIVNSNGFDYANIEEPFYTDDYLVKYRASTFNLKNGEKVETVIPKKSFIIENLTSAEKLLKFNFPDVHEGSVIEYSYTVRFSDNDISRFVPWDFQSDIPVILSSISVSYPDIFKYKISISGASNEVSYAERSTDDFIAQKAVKVLFRTWSTQNMPAFKEEPYIRSERDHLTKITFELASVDFPGSTLEEITPTYETLSKKLLRRDDFGFPLERSGFLKNTTEEITTGLMNDLSKLIKIHKYVSTKIMYNGLEGYTAPSTLQSVFKKEKGNSAEINMILIGMLRAENIPADPVILSTRSNGSLNTQSALVQQFNYLVAYVNIDGKYYLVDATDPLRPFNILPFDCLNNTGRLISLNGSKFVDLRNDEKYSQSLKLDLTLDNNGKMDGNLENKNAGYNAYNIRKFVKLEGEEGYLDLFKSAASDMEISDFRLSNTDKIDSALTESCKIRISNGAQLTEDRILINPFFNVGMTKNLFYEKERKFPIDFGCPREDTYSLTLKIPDGYTVVEKPDNISIAIGKDEAMYDFSCIVNSNEMKLISKLKITKTSFQPSEYITIRNFYSKILQKQSELVVIKKNPVIN